MQNLGVKNKKNRFKKNKNFDLRSRLEQNWCKSRIFSGKKLM